MRGVRCENDGHEPQQQHFDRFRQLIMRFQMWWWWPWTTVKGRWSLLTFDHIIWFQMWHNDDHEQQQQHLIHCHRGAGGPPQIHQQVPLFSILYIAWFSLCNTEPQHFDAVKALSSAPRVILRASIQYYQTVRSTVYCMGFLKWVNSVFWL
jgi:hypothetical protein